MKTEHWASRLGEIEFLADSNQSLQQMDVQTQTDPVILQMTETVSLISKQICGYFILADVTDNDLNGVTSRQCCAKVLFFY